MNAIKQLVRQPIKSTAGLLLIVLAVAALTVCVGQSFAADATQARLDRSFLSIALPNSGPSYSISQTGPGEVRFDFEDRKRYDAQTDAWALAFAADHPDIVKSVGDPGLVSAYMPDMELINFNETYRVILNEQNRNAPHDRAVVEFTLLEWALIENVPHYVEIDGKQILLNSSGTGQTQIYIIGTIQQVFGLQSGYSDPTGYTARFYVQVPSDGEYDVPLVEGQRYLAYITEYDDLDYYLRASLSKQKRIPYVECFEPDDIIYPPEDDPDQFGSYAAKLRYSGNNLTGLTNVQAENFRAIGGNTSVLATFKETCDYIQEDGTVRTVTGEEYCSMYPSLHLVPLTGTAEEFLESPEGTAWRQALADLQINNHAFPIIGIDSMLEITDFNRNMAEIVQGREFTPEDLEDGTAVCLISESLAQANNLKIGDTICPQFYAADPNYPGQQSPYIQPAAAYFFASTTTLEDAREYTIVGLYKSETEWTDASNNPYGFTPNTIFVPKKSVGLELLYGDNGFYRSFIIQNGRLDDFQSAVLAAGFDGLFYLNDNGYSTVEASMESYRQTASQALVVGLAVFTILVGLYTLLFPGRLGGAVATMASLGASRLQRILFVITNSLGILIPGTLAGVGLGLLLWQKVVDTLAADAAAVLAIEQDPAALGMTAAAALSVMTLVTLLLAIPVTVDRNLSRRRKE